MESKLHSKLAHLFSKQAFLVEISEKLVILHISDRYQTLQKNPWVFALDVAASFDSIAIKPK